MRERNDKENDLKHMDFSILAIFESYFMFQKRLERGHERKMINFKDMQALVK